MSSPILTPPAEFHQSASVCIERTFEVPQAAAGPLVTPTKPILRTLFAASAGVTAAASESADASPRRAARNDIARYPIVIHLRAPPPPDEEPEAAGVRLLRAKILVNMPTRDCRQSAIICAHAQKSSEALTPLASIRRSA